MLTVFMALVALAPGAQSGHYQYTADSSEIIFTSYMVAGPFSLSVTGDDTDSILFQRDFLASQGGERAAQFHLEPVMWSGTVTVWKHAYASSGLIDLLSNFGGSHEHAIAYALVEVSARSTLDVSLEVRSDDGIAIWLNGLPVLNHMTYRTIDDTPDFVNTRLRKGRNTILLKILNGTDAWKFSCRMHSPGEGIRAAIDSGSTRALESLVQSGVNINSRLPSGGTALLRAADWGSPEIVKWLLDHHADSRARTPSGMNALDLAVRSARLDVAEIYRKAGMTETRPLPPLSGQVDDLFQRWVSDPQHGVCVAIVEHEAIVHLKGYGHGEGEGRPLLNARSPMGLGSTSKVFIAAVALRLSEEGLLRLDEPIRHFLPELPDFMDPVTVRHLLTHESGLPRELRLPDDPSSGYDSWGDFLVLLQSYGHLDHEPGTHYTYCSIGYVLLQLVCERAAHEQFPEVLRTRILVPAGMNDTSVDAIAPEATISATIGPAVATATRPRDVSRVEASHSVAFRNRGNIISTATDMARFARVVQAHRILSAPTWEEATTPGTECFGGLYSYGFGWFLFERNGRHGFYHDGVGGIYRSMFINYPDEHLSVIILSNADDDINCIGLGYTVSDMALAARGKTGRAMP